MAAEQMAEITPTSPYRSRRFKRQALLGALAGIIPNNLLTRPDGLDLHVGPEVSRRRFLSIFPAVMINPDLGFKIAGSLAEASSPHEEVKKPVLPEEERILVTNLRLYVNFSKIGSLGEGFEANQKLIDELTRSRRVTRDPLGTDYAWDGIALDGLNISSAGFRINTRGQFEYFEVVSVADLTKSRFNQELVDVSSRFSKKGLPGYRLIEALKEYFLPPIEAFKFEETRRPYDDMNGIRISGKSLNNYLYIVNFGADGLMNLEIRNPNVQQSGPLA